MTNQRGAIPILILVAILGIVGVLVLTSSVGFKDNLFSSIFPKKASEAAGSTDWPQLQHDPQHTGRSALQVDPSYEVAWAWIDKNHIVKNYVGGVNKSITDGFESGFQFNVIFSEQMQPIIADGKTFFGSMDGVMYAVNAESGNNVWDFSSNGPIMEAAAYDSGVLVFDSMDGNIYGLDGTTGAKKWSYQTGAGVNAAPIIANSTVFVGSRDGNFYALDLLTGNLKWKYTTRVEPISSNSPFNQAPIIAPAALSEDGSVVVFGAENMFVYGLNTTDGSEKWTPKKVVGQSFLYSWPMIKNGKVIIRTMSSMQGSEWLMEDVLNGLSSTATQAEENTAISNWLTQNPEQKTMYVFDVNTGVEPYQVAMGRVTGNNYAPHISVVDNQDRVLTYWRSRVATFSLQQGSFGTNYCPDISALDLISGSRVRINNSNPNKFCAEIDNGFQFTIGGNNLYMANHFRGTKVANLSTGAIGNMTIPLESYDCGHGRYLGAIIYRGNDSDDPCNPTRLPTKYNNSIGFAGISIASVNGQPMLFINEGGAGLISALRHKP